VGSFLFRDHTGGCFTDIINKFHSGSNRIPLPTQRAVAQDNVYLHFKTTEQPIIEINKINK
jgi:hypothetical protein